MSEEQVVEQVATEATEESNVVAVEGTEKQLSAIEQKAIEMGWRPKSEFSGEEDEFIDATEFVRRKPLFDKIEHQSKELKEVKKVLKSLQDHHVKVKETEFQRAVDYLKSQKKLAYEEGDTDKIIEIDDQIAEMRESKRTQAAAVEVTKEATTVHPDFANWVSQNSWYAQDKALRYYADDIGTSYAEENPHLSPVQVLKYVTGKVKEAFPNKFTNPNKNKPAAVDGGTQSTKLGKSSDSFQLTEDEERVMKQFVRAGILTKEQYVADIKAMRGDK